MKRHFLFLTLASLLMLSFFTACNQQEKTDIQAQPQVKNIIYMIGDGMSIPQIYGAMLANEGPWVFSQFPYSGFVTTPSANKKITDSAAGGTALACGKKTNNGEIGMDADSVAIPSILDIMAQDGKATGLVVTSYVTHATPAAFFGKTPSRNNYEILAEQLMDSPYLNVVIGGGRKHFTERADGRNLLEEMTQKGWTVYDTLNNIDINNKKYAVIANEGHMPAASERGNFLPDATEIALKSLTQNEKGYFLMIEGSQIDFAGHDNDSVYLVDEMVDFNKTIAAALKIAQEDPNTLLIVTADHETGGLALVDPASGYTNVAFKFNTANHSCLPVPIFAYGPGAEKFSGWMDNTEIYGKMLELLNNKM